MVCCDTLSDGKQFHLGLQVLSGPWVVQVGAGGSGGSHWQARRSLCIGPELYGLWSLDGAVCPALQTPKPCSQEVTSRTCPRPGRAHIHCFLPQFTAPSFLHLLLRVRNLQLHPLCRFKGEAPWEAHACPSAQSDRGWAGPWCQGSCSPATCPNADRVLT